MPRYTDEELHALEHDPDYWDWDSAEVHPATPNVGLRVVVTFDGPIARVLTSASSAAGLRLIDFIRAAAMDKAHAIASDQAAATFGDALQPERQLHALIAAVKAEDPVTRDRILLRAGHLSERVKSNNT